MKNIIIGLSSIPFLATPALAESDYMRGYKEGLNVGNFIAYCVSWNTGMYDSRDSIRPMLRYSYDSMNASNRQWARDQHPECVI